MPEAPAICPPASYELTVVSHLWTQNKHITLSRFERIEWIRDARAAGKVYALEAKIPTMKGIVAIDVTPLQCRGPLADPGNHFPVVKAVIDGLRDARVLIDDTSVYVEHLTMHKAERCQAKDTGLRIILTPVALPL